MCNSKDHKMLLQKKTKVNWQLTVDNTKVPLELAKFACDAKTHVIQCQDKPMNMPSSCP